MRLDLTREVQLQTIRRWQRYHAGSSRPGRRPSLPSEAALRWFLHDQGWGIDSKGRVQCTYAGRLGSVSPAMVRIVWARWAAVHRWQDTEVVAKRWGRPELWSPVPGLYAR